MWIATESIQLLFLLDLLTKSTLLVESIRFLLEVSYCRYESDDRHRPSWWCVATDLDAYYSQPMHPPSHLLLRRWLVHGRQCPWGYQQSLRLLASLRARKDGWIWSDRDGNDSIIGNLCRDLFGTQSLCQRKSRISSSNVRYSRSRWWKAMCLWPFDTFWVWNLSRFFSCTQIHSEKEFNSLLRCNTVLNKKLLKILDDCLEASGRPTHFLDTTIRRATCMCLSILPFSLVDFVATRASIHVSYVRFHSITWKRSRRPTTTRNLHELLTEKDMNETERGIQGIFEPHWYIFAEPCTITWQHVETQMRQDSHFQFVLCHRWTCVGCSPLSYHLSGTTMGVNF